MPMKIYDKNIEKKVLEQNVYLGYQYYIVSYGSHPCCYIKLTKNNYDISNLSVHGGISYNRTELWCDKDCAKFIGWDYAHYTDFMLCKYNEELNMEGHKWTLNELQEEVRKAIEELDIENKKYFKGL